MFLSFTKPSLKCGDNRAERRGLTGIVGGKGAQALGRDKQELDKIKRFGPHFGITISFSNGLRSLFPLKGPTEAASGLIRLCTPYISIPALLTYFLRSEPTTLQLPNSFLLPPKKLSITSNCNFFDWQPSQKPETFIFQRLSIPTSQFLSNGVEYLFTPINSTTC